MLRDSMGAYCFLGFSVPEHLRCSTIVADAAWAAFQFKYGGTGAYTKFGTELARVIPERAVAEAAASSSSARGAGLFSWL